MLSHFWWVDLNREYDDVYLAATNATCKCFRYFPSNGKEIIHLIKIGFTKLYNCYESVEKSLAI